MPNVIDQICNQLKPTFPSLSYLEAKFTGSGPVYPYIVFSEVSHPKNRSVVQESGELRLRFNVYSKSKTECKDLADQVENEAYKLRYMPGDYRIDVVRIRDKKPIPLSGPGVKRFVVEVYIEWRRSNV